MSKYVILLYGAMSVLTFILFALDWRGKRTRRMRLPETDLLLASLLGGSFGGCLAMIIYRHKTYRRRFLLGLPLMALVQVGILVLVRWKMG